MEKQLIPKLRFPEFKGENSNILQKYYLEDICNFSTGKNIKQKEASPDFEIPCVRYGELYHMYNEVITRVINKTNLDKSELLFSEGNEILLPSAGEDPLDIGSASALTIKDVAIGRTINILRPKDKNIYSQIFVSYYINQKLKKEIAALAKGVSISNVYNSDLKKLKIILPPLFEQQKIASFLTSVDERITLLTQQKEKLEQYKKGIMQQLFSQEIRFKDDNGNDFPEWKEKKLGDLFENIGGTALEKYQQSNGKYKFISIGNYSKDGKYIDNGQRIDLNAKSSQKLLDKGNLVMVLNDKTKTGDIIGSSILIDENDKYIYNQRSERLICNHNIISLYAWHYLNCKKFRDDIFTIAQGGTQIYVNFSAVKTIKVLLPSKREQQKIADFLTAIDIQIEQVGKQIDATTNFKKGLLQQMFV